MWYQIGLFKCKHTVSVNAHSFIMNDENDNTIGHNKK